MPPRGISIQRSELVSLVERLVSRPTQQRTLPGLELDRADVIGTGLIIIEELLLVGAYSSLIAFGNGGVRHGIFLRETFGKDGRVR